MLYCSKRREGLDPDFRVNLIGAILLGLNSIAKCSDVGSGPFLLDNYRPALRGPSIFERMRRDRCLDDSAPCNL
jgi:hypothetical protein